MSEYTKYLDSLKNAVEVINEDLNGTRKALAEMKAKFLASDLTNYDAIVMFEELDLAFYEVYEDPEDLEIFDSITDKEANELYKWYDEALRSLDNMNFYIEKYSQILALIEEVEYIFEGIEDDN